MDILKIWYKPKVAVRTLEHSPSYQFRFLAGLTFIFFIQLCILCLSLENTSLSRLWTLPGIILIFLTILALGVGTFSVVYVSTLAIWIGTKHFNGQGTFNQTRAAVVYSFLCSVPVGFLLLSIYFAIRQPNQGLFLRLIEMFSTFGIVATIFYVLIILVKTISEVHSFALWRAFFSVVYAILVLSALTLATLKYF